MYPERPDPKPLRENAGCSFQGWHITHDLDWSATPLPGYRPALGGKEVNTHPEQLPRRYARPNKRKSGLEAALSPLSRCLVTACHAKHLCFAFQPTDRIFSHGLYAFPLDRYAAFTVLQSRIHEVWVRLLSSSLGVMLRYTASECFDTFPFPYGSPGHEDVTLEEVGRELYTVRAAYMRSHQIGLTKLYNDLPPSLRGLHEAMDLAVLAAYGWEDVDPSNSREIVERLYALNASRSDVP